jgi:hypothetical protein
MLPDEDCSEIRSRRVLFRSAERRLMSRTDPPTDRDETQQRAFWDSDQPATVWLFAAGIALAMMVLAYLAAVWANG